MLRALVLFAIASMTFAACAGQPIVVLDVSQQGAPNGNSTAFVLYDDGLVIYASKESDSLHPYLQARLTKAELAELSPPSSLLSLKRGYITFPASDVPEYRLHFTIGKRRAEISVLGFLRQTGGCGNCRLTPLPAALDGYLGKIIQYSNPQAKPWQPQAVQLEIAPASGRPAAKWPDNWPDLKSATLIRTDFPDNSPDWYCIAVPGKDWEELHGFTQSIGRNGTFTMDGKTWSIIQMRFVLPEEQKWDPIGACRPNP
jgi:hypothetical protein